MAATVAPTAKRTAGPAVGRLLRRHGWTAAVYVLLLALMAVLAGGAAIKPDYGAFEWSSLALGALPLALAAAAQTMVVLSGGIDLSIGPLMALANVLAVRAMIGHDFNYALVVAAIVLVEVTLAGALNGFVIVLTRVPDIAAKLGHTA